MIEIALVAAYRGAPHEVGAWAYTLRRNGEAPAGRTGSGRPRMITSRLSAEAAALSLALEEIVRDWEGEDIVVRTASAGLEGLFVRRGEGVPRDLSAWYARARQAAQRCASVRILPAQPEELDGLRAGLQGLLPGEAPGRVARASDPGFLRRTPE
ncbi:MAG TPA: hypothetical protein VKW04_13790 [Planctomycetota bacterium]|nr:hypothetical protein [Planctomycetota bacterium]